LGPNDVTQRDPAGVHRGTEEAEAAVNWFGIHGLAILGRVSRLIAWQVEPDMKVDTLIKTPFSRVVEPV
jgi:hypothetical protein